MAYVRLTWVDDVTPLNADNMNNIEDGIVENKSGIEEAKAESEIDSSTIITYTNLGWVAPTT